MKEVSVAPQRSFQTCSVFWSSVPTRFLDCINPCSAMARCQIPWRLGVAFTERSDTLGIAHSCEVCFSDIWITATRKGGRKLGQYAFCYRPAFWMTEFFPIKMPWNQFIKYLPRKKWMRADSSHFWLSPQLPLWSKVVSSVPGLSHQPWNYSLTLALSTIPTPASTV